MAEELLRQCVAARRAGLDFLTIWHTIIRVHPLTAKRPIQMAGDGRTWLQVPLTTGEHLVAAEEGFSLKDALTVLLERR